jgi:hypothetical protein
MVLVTVSEIDRRGFPQAPIGWLSKAAPGVQSSWYVCQVRCDVELRVERVAASASLKLGTQTPFRNRPGALRAVGGWVLGAL